MRRWSLIVGILVLEGAVLGAPPVSRPPLAKLPADAGIDARWIYDDVPKGLAQAKESGKPLLLVFR
jgi:hypothetical protein